MQRKDLAKEFSLIVQQEIKNHKDERLAICAALDEFRRRIQQVSEEVKKKCASLKSSQDFWISKIEELASLQDSSTKMTSHHLKDLFEKLSHKIKNIEISQQNRESYYLTTEDFEVFKEKVDQWLAHVRLSFARHSDSSKEIAKKLSDEFKKELKLHKEEVEEVLKNFRKAIHESEKSLDAFAINTSGIVRETEAVKKRAFIIEKNIENLYTQIERIKAKSS